MDILKDKVVWLTGASSGFGEALAYELSEQGAKVILSARREKELIRVKKNVKTATIIPIDLLDFESFESKTKEAINAFGRIDIIIHNGGIAQNSSALETTLEVQQKIMDTDYFSYVELTRCILPYFISQNSGQIVVVSGLLAKVGLANRTTYSAAKAALHGYFNSLRVELVNNNIDITILVPGSLKTNLTTKALGGNGEIAAKKPDDSGYPVDLAAEQAIEKIFKRKFETYIGNKKGKFLYNLSNHCPSYATKMILKKFKKN